jgi:hypothetical protein
VPEKEDSPDEEVKEAPKKKKKNKKKKKKEEKKDSEEEFLDQIVKETQPVLLGKRAIEVGSSVLRMDRGCFNYRKELKTLFSQFG